MLVRLCGLAALIMVTAAEPALAESQAIGQLLAQSAAPSPVQSKAPTQAPSPPRRPPDLEGPARAPAQPAPATSAGPTRLQTDVPLPGQRPATPPTSAASSGALSEDAALERVNSYMNSFQTLIANFSQLGADGRKYQGKLYIHRPGRMRFAYDPPATIEVIADGTSVAVRDRRLATQDNYFIGQTPLKFLLKEQIDLKRDVKVTRVVSTPDAIRVTVEDKATLGGTSRITIHYDPRSNSLKQWVIIDPQGYETSVQVANLDTSRRPDPALFRITTEMPSSSSSN